MIDYFYTIFLFAGNKRHGFFFIKTFSFFLLGNFCSFILYFLSILFFDTDLINLIQISFIVSIILLTIKLFFIGFKRNNKVENSSSLIVVIVYLVSLALTFANIYLFFIFYSWLHKY